jgi:K+-sensing histidine kinase KdpD
LAPGAHLQPLLGRLLHEPSFCVTGNEKSILYNRARECATPVRQGRELRVQSAVSPQRLQTLPTATRRHRYSCRSWSWPIVRLPVNHTTVALTFLLVVLGVASRWGLTLATTTAVVATLAFNYYFLPPIQPLRYRRSAELDCAAGFSQSAPLSPAGFPSAPAARLENATRRRKEVERLYFLSQQLLATDNVMELLNSIPQLRVRRLWTKRCGHVSAQAARRSIEPASTIRSSARNNWKR